MENPFDFNALPTEIAKVLHAVIKWRIAKDQGHDSIAAKHLVTLDDASVGFRDWSSFQGELRLMLDKRNVPIPETKSRDGRESRQRRLASQGRHLYLVPKER